MLGKDQPVILQLLEIPDEKRPKRSGRDHGAGRLRLPCWLASKPTATPMTAFKTPTTPCWWVPVRGPGMERADLLAANAAIFTVQGKGPERRGRNVKVLVGQPRQHQRLHRHEVGP